MILNVVVLRATLLFLLLLPFSLPELIRVRRCSGSACPYAGSWLVHTTLFQRVGIYLHSLKMEEATFGVMNGVRNIFQVNDDEMYFVNHLSQYEHELQKLHGFDVAMNLTHEFSVAAADGECNNLHRSKRQSLIALIPFFGGLPPNTTADHTVASRGQGNSLAKIDSKALQCMATTCSLLKFTSRVIIGVARDEDYSIIQEMLNRYNIQDTVTIKRFQLVKFANLPFHLLNWGRTYIVENNCRFIMNNDLTQNPDYELRYCSTASKAHMSYPHATPTLKDDMLGKLYISHVYYTESDTIHYSSNSTLTDFIIEATNATAAFLGARKNKKAVGNPSEYMSDLFHGRHCGTEGYALDFPRSPTVQHVFLPHRLRRRKF